MIDDAVAVEMVVVLSGIDWWWNVTKFRGGSAENILM